MDRQAAQIENRDQQRNENQTLQPMVWSFAFGEGAQPGGDAEPQNYDENKNAEQVGDEIQNVFGARVCNRLFVAVAGQRVHFGFRRLRRSFFGGGLHFGGLRFARGGSGGDESRGSGEGRRNKCCASAIGGQRVRVRTPRR